MLIVENVYFNMYTLAPETRAIAHDMLVCNCIMMPGMMLAFVISKGILRGGGDTRFLLVADSICVWVISIPLGALAGLVWQFPPFWIYFILRVEFPLKGIMCLIRYLSGKWIREIKATEE